MLVFITANRANKTEQENDQRNASLEKDIQAHGLKYYEVLGCYQEEGQELPTIEKTFRVSLENKNQVSVFVKLAAKYEQDAILSVNEKSNNKTTLIFNEESAEDLGEFQEVSEEAAINNGCYTIDNEKYYIAA
jgi:hypothetical protein